LRPVTLITSYPAQGDMNLSPITQEEEQTLQVVIEDWQTRTPVQRAIAVAVLRGHETPESVANYLQISVDEVRAKLPSIWGLLLDHNTQKIWIK
jgi:hypothetical protein